MRKPVFFIIAALIGILAATYSVGMDQIPIVAGALIFFIALGVSFVRGTDAIYIIVFAMLFSPEVGTGVQTGRTGGEGAGGLVLRLEDLILIAVGVGWLLRTAYHKRHFGIIRTPVNQAIGVYMMISLISTLLGVINGRVNLVTGIFHNGKFFEYFFLFFMILAHVRSKKHIRGIVVMMFVAFFLVLIYGYTQIRLDGSRVCAPFDREPNTFGGYIALLMCVCLGVVLNDNRIKVAVPLSLLFLFAFPPFLFTLSRASYMALVIGLAAFLVVSQHRIIVGAVFVGIIAILVLGVPLLPEPVLERIEYTFQRGTQYHVQIAGVDLDPSASARVVSYQRAVERWMRSPVFGQGVTGTHFIDGQYFRLLAEVGVVGLGAFLFMIWRLLVEVRKAYMSCEDKFFKGVGMGLFCGIIAVLGHAVSANSFVIIRISEPLWMLSGLVLLLPRLKDDEADHPPDAPASSFANTLPPLHEASLNPS